MTDLPKTFDPAAIEARWYAHWETEGRFRPERPDADPFTIVIPPPNVTGSLHIGHALDNTLQDILIRHARLRGKDALWVVGTDHAGIATQMVVERNLASQGVKRADMTRDQFVEHVWEWKAQSGGTITRQLRRLGASCDWANERFTMDEGFSRAVTKVFVDLYNQGLLYRDKRLVNWDPHFKSAISDLEVEAREVQGKFWHFRYSLEDSSGFISVATTRPETMLADMAVAVNPEDARYTALIGKKIRTPITGRLIPIVADEHADPALGSGAVKITPGHDFNDFEVGKRAGFKAAEMLNMLDAEARVIQTADGLVPADLIGLDRFEARAKVVELIEAAGLLEKIEDRVIQTPYGDRSGVVTEPWLTDQWYVDAKTLAGPAIDAVRNGAIRVVPETWKKTWFNWLENIQPWCVSRQLWWGHQIPVWYGPSPAKCGNGGHVVIDRNKSFLTSPTFVATSYEDAKRQAAIYYQVPEALIVGVESPTQAVEFASGELGHGYDLSGFASASLHPTAEIPIWRDPDVLDTWFSSALWPFGTLGWPELHPSPSGEGQGAGNAVLDADRDSPTPAPPLKGRGLLARHYPNDVLVSGFDILFFWDARMAMQGLHFMGEAPWKTLYLHGLVRDATGAKMSKSKGNTVDPLGLIDQYGADALRFTLAAMESQGRDIKLDERRVEGYRNFATKLWNAARFCQSNGIGASAAIEPPAAALPVNRWIIAETVKTIQALDLALADLRFDESANTIYQFVWATFCDWYLELIKPVLSPSPAEEGQSEIDETRAVAGWALDQILVMLHPFMPFITEELWHALGKRPYDLILAKWPTADARAIDPAAQREIDWLIRLVSEIRAVRTELNVPPAARIDINVDSADEALRRRILKNGPSLHRLARLDKVQFPAGLPLREQDGVEHDLATYGEIVLKGQAAAQIVLDNVTYVLPLEGVIDLVAERARLTKGLAAAEKERDALAGRLANPAFVERAKPEAVAKAREDHADKAAEAERLRAALARLG